MAPKETPKGHSPIDLTLQQIRRQFGDGSIMRLGDPQARLAPDVISTGLLSLDFALGVGGIPYGRVIEIYGAESSGKTTMALHIASEVQREGGTVAFVDAEHALDPKYAGVIGVNVNELLVSQPDTGEQALEITDMLVRSGAVNLIIIDSVAALVPKAEIEGEMGDTHVGLQARLMSQALRKLTASISRANCIVIFINQVREKIGVMYGSNLTTTGGRALKFYSSIRLEVRRLNSIKQGTDVIGSTTAIKVVKNKVAPPFKEVLVDCIFGQGFSRLGCLIDLAVEKKIIKKAGAWYSFGDEKLGQGKENVKEFFINNPDLLEQVERGTRAALGISTEVMSVTEFVRTMVPAEILAQLSAHPSGGEDEDEDEVELAEGYGT
ncbi:MAG: recombinase RecA [bacterium]